MTAIGTMIISLSGTHTFAKPSIVRYVMKNIKFNKTYYISL